MRNRISNFITKRATRKLSLASIAIIFFAVGFIGTGSEAIAATTPTATPSASLTAHDTATPTYSCSTGTLSGTECTITTTTAATSTPGGYSCSTGTLSGTSCSVTTTSAATATWGGGR